MVTLGLHHQRLVGEPVVVDRVLAVEGALGDWAMAARKRRSE